MELGKLGRRLVEEPLSLMRTSRLVLAERPKNSAVLRARDSRAPVVGEPEASRLPPKLGAQSFSRAFPVEVQLGPAPLGRYGVKKKHAEGRALRAGEKGEPRESFHRLREQSVARVTVSISFAPRKAPREPQRWRRCRWPTSPSSTTPRPSSIPSSSRSRSSASRSSRKVRVRFARLSFYCLVVP